MSRSPSITPRAAALAVALLATPIVGAQPAAAAWPGGNGPILFVGGGVGIGPGGPTELTSGIWSKRLGAPGLSHHTRDRTDGNPQSSPDGRWIVFTRRVDVPNPGGPGVQPATHIFRARSDGSAIAPVTGGAVFDDAPAFAPSGQRIIFSRLIPGAQGADLFSVRLDGTNLHRLTSGPADDRNPAFSPNRRVIAFDRFTRGGGPRHVHTMRPDGSRIVDATPGMGLTSEPEFNPVGNRIAFVRGVRGAGGGDLFAMRPDGARVRRLTGMRGRARGGFADPSYSPDRRLIVAEFAVEGQFSKLQVVRLRDRSWGATLGGRRMARSPDMSSPAWRPNRR